jgi:hypothetical protein
MVRTSKTKNSLNKSLVTNYSRGILKICTKLESRTALRCVNKFWKPGSRDG